MKIPENAKPYRAIVNGVEHVYEAGADVEVAPGVEELIEAAGNFPAAPDPVVPPFAGGGGGGGGGSLVVTLTRTVVDEQEIWSTDKTAGEIFAALPNVALLETIKGLTFVRPVIGFAVVDGYGYMVQYLEVGYDYQASFTGRYLFAATADAIMTTEEPEEPGDSPAD